MWQRSPLSSSSSSPATEVRSIPRILEQILLTLDAGACRWFVGEYCSPDCSYSLYFQHQITRETSPSPSLASHFNSSSKQVLSNDSILQFLEALHACIPDAIFLIHETQSASKGAQGHQISCKFSFSGLSIFELDIDSMIAKADGREGVFSTTTTSPSIQLPRSASAVQSDQSSQSVSEPERSSSSSPTSSFSSATDEQGVKPIMHPIQFTGDTSMHTNDTVKRKFSTVGRYVVSSHLHDQFEALKRSTERSGVRRNSVSGSSAVDADSALMPEMEEPLAAENSSLSTVGASQETNKFITSSSPLTDTLSAQSNHQSTAASLRRNIQIPSIDTNDGKSGLPHLLRGAFKQGPSSDTYKAGSNRSADFGFFTTDLSNPQIPLDTNSTISMEAMADYSPSAVLPTPKKVESAGLLRLYIHPETKKIYHVECTVHCNPV